MYLFSYAKTIYEFCWTSYPKLCPYVLHFKTINVNNYNKYNNTYRLTIISGHLHL